MITAAAMLTLKRHAKVMRSYLTVRLITMIKGKLFRIRRDCRVVENDFVILSPKSHIYEGILNSQPENAEIIILIT
jgi:hypothetical protein